MTDRRRKLSRRSARNQAQVFCVQISPCRDSVIRQPQPVLDKAQIPLRRLPRNFPGQGSFGGSGTAWSKGRALRYRMELGFTLWTLSTTYELRNVALAFSSLVSGGR